MQWLVFTILSVILLLAFRRPILRMMNVDTGPVDSLVGEVATVLDAIGPGAIGRAELRGSTWSARNLHSAESGARAAVSRRAGRRADAVPSA